MHINHHVAVQLANEHICALRADASRGRRQRRRRLVRRRQILRRGLLAVPAPRVGR